MTLLSASLKVATFEGESSSVNKDKQIGSIFIVYLHQSLTPISGFNGCIHIDGHTYKHTYTRVLCIQCTVSVSNVYHLNL